MPRSYTRKYMERPSPPYPANDYCGQVKRGNDGAMWLSSKVGSQSACTWKPVVRSPKRSPVRRSPVRRSPVRRSPVRRSPENSLPRSLQRKRSPSGRLLRRSPSQIRQLRSSGWRFDLRTGRWSLRN